MKTNHEPPLAVRNRSKYKAWMGCATALLSFAAGSLLTARMIRSNQVRADNNRVFELMIYHAVQGKGPELESVFREVSKLQAKYDLNVVGYWVPNDDPGWKDTFIYLVAHPSLDDAKKNWRALHADAAFPAYRKAAEPLIEKVNEQYKVDEVYMRPSDYSAMK